MGWLTAIAGLCAAAATVVAGAFAVYRYFALRERLAAVRDAFGQAVDLLSSSDAVHQRTGAIMLRRFFDEKTEQGSKGTPYAGEALNVIAATLRGAETGALQKLLADGLAYAPTLHGADLQKTNLHQAYLGSRAGRTVNLTSADFFRADLTNASLKGAIARHAVFYQARLINTVLSDADLCGANFYEADLSGSRFDRASLQGASFADARNVPDAVASRLDAEGVYDGTTTDGEANGTTPKIFLSRPGAADIETRRYVWALSERISDHGVEIVELDRNDYAATGAVAEVRRVMGQCAGVVIGAVPDLEIDRATWRSATPEAREMSDTAVTSPWTMIELGLAIGLGLPVLLAMAEGVDAEMFDFGLAEPGIALVRLDQEHRSHAFLQVFDDWLGAVRETATRSGG